MKNFPFILIILFLLAGCNKTNPEDVTSTEVTPVKSALLKSPWKITYLVSNGIDKTFEFKDFRFTFYSNNLITGANDIISENGSWDTVSESSKTKLIIDFSSSSLLTEVTGEWEILSRSATSITMQHIGGGSGGQTDYMTMTRI